jgi:hypothetical protein
VLDNSIKDNDDTFQKGSKRNILSPMNHQSWFLFFPRQFFQNVMSRLINAQEVSSPKIGKAMDWESYHRLSEVIEP